jgi:protein tyrosine phosphatase
MCHHYWPVEGSERFNDFEVNKTILIKKKTSLIFPYFKVNLVSEHIWSDDYVVRSFYLKKIPTMETRTVTQFHFLTWNEFNNPPSTKSILDFRRYVVLVIIPLLEINERLQITMNICMTKLHLHCFGCIISKIITTKKKPTMTGRKEWHFSSGSF